MKAKNKIIKIRKQNPLVTGSEIARKVGVCRQYVSSAPMEIVKICTII